MKKTTEGKTKLTDAERYKRFVDMAHEVEASDNMKDFDEAFKKVVNVPIYPSLPHERCTKRDNPK